VVIRATTTHQCNQLLLLAYSPPDTFLASNVLMSLNTVKADCACCCFCQHPLTCLVCCLLLLLSHPVYAFYPSILPSMILAIIMACDRTVLPCYGTCLRASACTAWTQETSSTHSSSAPTATGCALLPRCGQQGCAREGGGGLHDFGRVVSLVVSAPGVYLVHCLFCARACRTCIL
jgi:hypothetical protein